MDKDKLLERYEKGLSSVGKNRSLYLGYAKDFLDHSDGTFDRETVLKHLDRLKRKYKYSDGTLNFIFRVIRTIYSRSQYDLVKEGIDWPFRRGEAPRIREDKINAPALDPDIIVEMIGTIKIKGEPEEKAFLSLSTTYGVRAEEMEELEEDDVNIKDKTIHIATVKHGRERTHTIPDEILPALEGYDFNTPVSEYGLLAIWHRIEWRIGFPHVDQVGWHSIRRTLNTLLEEKVSRNTLMSFMRWKQRTSSDMAFRYSAQRFVGRDTIATKVVGEAKDVDAKIFQAHPFIEYWR